MNESKFNEISFNSPQIIQKQMQNEIESVAQSKNIDKIEESTEISSFGKYVNLETLTFKNIYEHFALLSLYIWNKLKVNENNHFPFDKSSKIYSFYITVFPFLKLICLFAIVFVLYFTIISIVKALFMKKSKSFYNISRIGRKTMHK